MLDDIHLKTKGFPSKYNLLVNVKFYHLSKSKKYGIDTPLPRFFVS